MKDVSTYGLKSHRTNTDGFAFEKTTRKLQALSEASNLSRLNISFLSEIWSIIVLGKQKKSLISSMFHFIVLIFFFQNHFLLCFLSEAMHLHWLIHITFWVDETLHSFLTILAASKNNRLQWKTNFRVYRHKSQESVQNIDSQVKSLCARLKILKGA